MNNSANQQVQGVNYQKSLHYNLKNKITQQAK